MLFLTDYNFTLVMHIRTNLLSDSCLSISLWKTVNFLVFLSNFNNL